MATLASARVIIRPKPTMIKENATSEASRDTVKTTYFTRVRPVRFYVQRMIVEELEEELRHRRVEEQELTERCRALEEEAKKRRLINEVLEQRKKNKALKRRLIEKYKIPWPRRTSRKMPTKKKRRQ